MTANFNNNEGKGRLATDRYDFEKHVNGTSRRHTDAQIDISSPITELTASTVHDALVAMNNKIINSSSFVTIGDGFDIYQNGVFQDTANAAPSLNTEFTDVFTNTLSTRYKRLRDGGVVFIKAGTYKITATVDVPPGIIIMGEGFGTKLVNRIVANGGTESPLFRFKSDINHDEDKSIVSADNTYDPLLTIKSCGLVNLVIADNYVKPAFFGDTTYTTANNKTLPLIYVENGAGLECRGVTFLGRSLISDWSQTSHSAIGIDPLSSTSYSTKLSVISCAFDGFNRALSWKVLNGSMDYLELKDNKIRVFGPEGGLTTAAESNVIFANGCNMDIQGNYIWTDGNLNSLVYVDAFVGTLTAQGKSKINISNNTFVANKVSASATTTSTDVDEIAFNAAISADISTKCVVFVMNNEYDSTSGYKVQFDYSTGNKAIYITDAVVNVGEGASTTSFGTHYSASNSLISLSGASSISIDDTLGNVLSSSAGTLAIGGSSAGKNISIVSNTSGSVLVNAPSGILNFGSNFMILGGGQVISLTSVSSTSYNVAFTDYLIAVDTSAVTSGISITLPVLGSTNNGRAYVIKDVGGQAVLNNIVINASSGETIDGASFVTLSLNWQSITVVGNGTNWMII